MYKKLSKLLLLILSIVLFASANVFAADPASDTGTITISVMDETGADFAGRWYLRQGGSSGYLVRNGTKTETFTYKAGTYYLELQPKYPGYIYYTVFSANPQTLSVDGSIKFEAQYFTTEDELDAAEAAGEPTITTTSTSTSTTTITSTADTTSTTTSSSSSDTTSTSTATDSTTKSTTTKKISYHYVPAATFETPPADSDSASASSSSSDSTSSASSSLTSVPQLAATGPGLLLFTLAPLFGLLAVRRKK